MRAESEVTVTDTRAHVPTRVSVPVDLPEQAALTCAADGRVVRCNAAFTDLYQADEDTVRGKHLEDLLSADDRGAPLLQLADGARIPVRATRLPAESGELFHVCFTDRSKRVSARAALLRRYLELLRISHTAAFTYEPGTRTTQWLPSGYPVLGLMPGMLSTGLDALVQLLHPDDVARARDAWRAHLRTHERMLFVARCLAFDGGITRVCCVAERVEEGVTVGYVSEIDDFYGKPEQDSELLRRAQEAAEVGHWHVDLRTGALSTSGRAAKALEPADKDAAHMLDAVHPEDRPAAQRQLDAIVAGELPGPHRMELRSIEGDRCMLVHTYPELDDTGEVVGIGGTVQDVSRLRALERQVAEQRMQLRGLSQSTGIGTWQRVTGGDVVHLSAQACVLLGLEPTEALDRSVLRAMIHPDDREAVAQVVDRTDEDLEVLAPEVECRLVRPDGAVRWLRWNSQFGGQTAEGGYQVFGTVQDMTELRELERDLTDERARAGGLGSASDTGTWTVNFDSELVELTGGVFEAFGLPSGPLDITVTQGRIHPEDAERVRKFGAGLVKGSNDDKELDFRAIAEDGSTRLLRVIGRFVDENGPPRLVGTVRDITGSGQDREHIGDDRERLRDIARYSEVGGWEWEIDKDHCVLYGILRERASDSADGSGVVPLATLLGFIPDGERDTAWEILQRIREGQRIPGPFDFRSVLDGRTYVIETHLEFNEPADGPRFVRATCRDVTKMRALEREIADDRERLREITSREGIGVWEWVPGAESFSCWGLAREVTGADENGVAALDVYYALVHPKDRAALAELIGELSGREPPATGQLDLRVREGGDYRIIESRIEARRRADGVLLLRGTVRDVTEVRALEREHAQDRERLHELTASARIGFWEREGGSDSFTCWGILHELLGSDEQGRTGIRDLLEAVHPADRSRIAAEFDWWPEPGTPTVEHTEMRVWDGQRYRTLEVRVSVLERPGRIPLARATVRDVTEVRELEREHAQDQERLRGLASHIEAGVWEWVPGSEVCHTWGLISMITGVAEGEPLPISDFYALLDEDDREVLDNTIRRWVDPSVTTPTHIELRIGAGEAQRAIESSIHATAREDGTRVIRGVCRDLTNLRKLESKVSEDQARWRSMVSFGDVGSFQWDTTQREIMVSPELRAMLKLGGDVLYIDQFLGERVPEAEREGLFRLVEQLEGDRPPKTDVEFPVITPDGEELILAVHIDWFEHQGRRIVFGLTRDITRQRALERRLADDDVLFSLDRAPGIGAWTLHTTTARIEPSDTLREMFGFGRAEEITLERVLRILHPEDRETVAAQYEQSVREGRVVAPETEFRILLGDEVRTLRNYLTIVTDNMGGPMRMVGTVYDVTSLRELRQRAITDELRAPGAGRVMDLGTWEWDPIAELITFSVGFRGLFFPDRPGPVRTRDVLDVIHPEDRDRIALYMANATDPDQSVVTDLEFRAALPDGQWRMLRMHAEVTIGPGGARRFIGTTHDVTEQRVLERQLAEHEALLSGAGKVTGVATWSWDGATGAVECSPALRELLGIANDGNPITRERLNEVVHRHDRLAVANSLGRLSYTDGPLRADVECRVVQPGGAIRVLRVYGEVASNPEATYRRIIGTVHDLTRLRELEREVAHDRVQLAEARRTARIGSWAWRVGSAELEIGAEAYEVFGLDAERVGTFERALERIHADDKAKLEAAISRVLGPVGSGEVELRYRDGEDHYKRVYVYGERITDENGEQWLVGNVHDLTRLRELEQAVEEGETRLAGLNRVLEIGTWSWDAGASTVGLSARLRELWRFATDDQPGAEALLERLHEEDRRRVWQQCRTVLRTGKSAEFEARFTDMHGNPHKIHVFAERKTDAEGNRRLVGSAYDLTEQWLAETKVERSGQRYADLVAASPMGIALVDDQARIADVNEALCELLGTSRERVVGMAVTELAHDDDQPCSYESFFEYAEASSGQPRRYTVRRADGSGVQCEVRTAASVQDDGRTFWVMMYTDVGEQGMDAKPRGVDELTGLLNRAGVQAELRALLANGHAAQLAVLFCDVDNFARINDSLGHDFGDDVLIALAERLRTELPPHCVAARHSGDEFVVVCSDVRAVGGLDRLAERISELLGQPAVVHGQQVQVSVSIGAAVPSDGLDSEVDLLRFADAAMFESKRGGSGSFSVAGAALIESMGGKLQLESQLRQALAGADPHSGLMLHFQSIVDTQGVVVGAEALVRWDHPERGMLSPDKFLTVAAEADLLRALDNWVLRSALGEASRWPDSGRPVRVAVNLSALLPGTQEFDETVRAVLAETGIDPSRVVLELVETSLVTLPAEGIAVMRELVADGVQFAVDDFGTGYSSLARLKDLPVQIIKVDRKFVAGVNHDTSDTAVVRAVVDLANAMGRRCVAEGVELVEQFETLRAEGVDEYQGWLFSRPLPAAEFRALIQE